MDYCHRYYKYLDRRNAENLDAPININHIQWIHELQDWIPTKLGP